MNHIKLFEGKVNKAFVIVFMQGGIPEDVHIFYDEESAKNALINTIHDDAKDEEGEDYGCKNIFDIDELIEYWNKGGIRLYEQGNEIYFFEKEVEKKKYDLYPELQIRKDSKKYNI